MSVNVSPDAPSYLIGDPLHFRQILTNIVGNAIKFTEKDSISVSVKALVSGDERIKFQITVSGTGIGMTSEQCKNVFGAFIRGILLQLENLVVQGLGYQSRNILSN